MLDFSQGNILSDNIERDLRFVAGGVNARWIHQKNGSSFLKYIGMKKQHW